MAQQLAVESPQNDFLNGLARVSSTVGGLLNDTAQAYSTFIGAKTVNKMQKAQGVDYQNKSTTSPETFAGNTVSYVTYSAIALAVLGTLAVIYKAVK